MAALIYFVCDLFVRLVLEDDESISNDARLAAYLYIRATDAWQAVSDGLRLRPNYDQEISEVFFAVDLLIRNDKLFRAFAFTKSEAKDHIEKQRALAKYKHCQT